jgi:hypothetical protein
MLMAAVTRGELHAMVDALEDGHLMRARDYLGRVREDASRAELDALRHELHEQGFLARLAQSDLAEASQRHNERVLAEVKGRSVSATIVEDRGPSE